MIAAHHANQRLAILCDADNAEIIEGERRRLKLRQLLGKMNGRELTRAIYFRPFRNFSDQAQRHIEQAGFEVRRTFKNSDAWIAAEAFALAAKHDVIAFVGGDGDFEPTIIMLRALGVRVEVWSWPSKVSRRVRELADVFVPLTPDLLRPRRDESDAGRQDGTNLQGTTLNVEKQ